MKLKFIYYILFAASILTMSACAESDDKGGNDTPPAGSLPSTEFKPNNLPDEPYAEDAIRIEAQNEQAPFYAIELMGMGTTCLAPLAHIIVFLSVSQQNLTVVSLSARNATARQYGQEPQEPMTEPLRCLLVKLMASLQNLEIKSTD